MSVTGGGAAAEPRGDGPTGIVLDVQRYALDDGDGIRTTVFLKGCPLRCPWCHNPESVRPAPEVAFRAERCEDERACVRACPRGAIAPGPGPVISPGKCEGCGVCVDACPTRALSLVGRRVTVADLVALVRRDAPFQAASGGGVTVSGGEPLLQAGFVAAFLAACKRAGIATAIETSGHARRSTLAGLLGSLDRVYLDLKVIAADEHRRLTGVGNALVLENARWLAASGAPVTFRMPLVPGMTLTRRNVEETAAFLAALGVPRVELCPYHDGGRHKLARLGGREAPPQIPAPDPAEVEGAVAAFRARRITARVLEGPHG